MKRLNYLYISFLSVFAFALCACQSDKQVSGPVRVKDVALKASLSDVMSRTTMTDTYGGAFAETWNNDVLSIYHSYLSNGTAQSLMPLSFTTTDPSGSSAVFVYREFSDYAYNPGKPLYAFNKLSGTGQCTPSVTGIAATPLSLSLTGWANQDGTLTGTQNAALYDAMMGYTTTDAATGVPGPLTMNHLGGMVCFHLTCDNFTVGQAVSGIQFSDGSASPCCFPGSATVSVASGGAVTTTPVFTRSWSPSGSLIPYSYTDTSGDFPTTSTYLDVYLSTFPTTIVGPLTVTLYLGVNEYSGVVSPSYVLTSSKMKVIPIVLGYSYSKLYAWDATDFKPVNIGLTPTNYNAKTISGTSPNPASYACKNCPNNNEITWFLKDVYYWDDGNQGANGGNTMSYTMANGGSTKAGMWFHKKSNIEGYSTTAYNNTMRVSATQLSAMSIADISALNLSSNYFFLPAVGYTESDSGFYYGGGTKGCYWSSIGSNFTLQAVGLNFDSSGANTSIYDRKFGYSLWTAQ